MVAHIKDLEAALKALSNRRRIGIVQFLRKEKEASVSDIAEKISLSFRSTSRHLAVLLRANILEREQRGAQMFYSISNELPEAAKKIISIF